MAVTLWWKTSHINPWKGCNVHVQVSAFVFPIREEVVRLPLLSGDPWGVTVLCGWRFQVTESYWKISEDIGFRQFPALILTFQFCNLVGVLPADSLQQFWWREWLDNQNSSKDKLQQLGHGKSEQLLIGKEPVKPFNSLALSFSSNPNIPTSFRLGKTLCTYILPTSTNAQGAPPIAGSPSKKAYRFFMIFCWLFNPIPFQPQTPCLSRQFTCTVYIILYIVCMSQYLFPQGGTWKWIECKNALKVQGSCADGQSIEGAYSIFGPQPRYLSSFT